MAISLSSALRNFASIGESGITMLYMSISFARVEIW
jgi:hypothetical protein